MKPRMRTFTLASFVAVIVSLPLLAAAELPAAGTLVSSDNAERYAEALNPTERYMIAHGAVIPVSEYRRYEWQPLYRAATEKYAAQVTLAPDGREILNYVAGAPFPTIDDNDPHAGTKWMWNHEQKMA